MSTSPIGTSRSLHLVDLENLVGDPRATGSIVRDTFDEYLRVAGWEWGDQVLVASNPWLIAEVMFSWPVPCSPHAVHGRDGADVMLLSHAPPELVAKRYGRLVVGSGDGIFAARATQARDLGVDVLVVAREGSCSWNLRRLGHRFLADVPLATTQGPDYGLAA